MKRTFNSPMGKLNEKFKKVFIDSWWTFNSPMGKLNERLKEILYILFTLSIPLWVS